MRAAQKRRGPACVLALLPHAVLILSLIVYALMGAALFSAIERRSGGNDTRDDFLRKVLRDLRNVSDVPDNSTLNTVARILKDYKVEWSQRPERWHFYDSLFFCCTVFTTVGYGEIYPVTVPGRVACILYATVGIPLMLLVITDAGDILAVLFSKSYRSLLARCRRVYSRAWSPRQKPQELATVRRGTYVFRRDDRRVTVHSSVIQNTSQLHNNTELFDRIVAREMFRQKGPLTRSCSCPELNQIISDDFWDFTSIGQEMDRFNVPFWVILTVVFAYLLIWAMILRLWEKELDPFEAFYFCFITLTTIGFGDIIPRHPKFFMLTFLFIITGMAIMSMAFKLGQSRIVSCYRRFNRCISCLGVGKVGNYVIQRE